MVMKRFLLGSIAAAAVLITGSAMAADMGPPPYQPPTPTPAPVHNWTGFYLGGAFGYALWDADTSLSTGGFTGGVSNNGGRGWIGQAIGGYDYQFSVLNLNLVAGVFADYDFGNVKGKFTANSSIAPLSTAVGPENEKSFWSAGGRIGWLVTPQILSYWSGGYTATHFDGVTFAGTGAALAATMSINSNNYHGWFLGGGVEAQSSFLPGLFFNTEYRFASYNTATLPLINSAAAIGTASNLNIHPYVQTVMSGLRYKFNWTP
jgi:outer membrane immunogenic protein